MHIRILLLLLLSLIGFLVSFYIFYKKRKGEKLFCLIGTSCNEVVNSKYASTLGIPNELLGILYYLMVPFAFAAFGGQFVGILQLVAVVAVVFSFYLTYIQFFVLEKLCEYCLTVNFVNVILFFLIFFK